MNRRGFFGRGALGLAASVALPAVRSLAPATPVLYGDGKHDDQAALDAFGECRMVRDAKTGKLAYRELSGQRFANGETIKLGAGKWTVRNCVFMGHGSKVMVAV